MSPPVLDSVYIGGSVALRFSFAIFFLRLSSSRKTATARIITPPTVPATMAATWLLAVESLFVVERSGVDCVDGDNVSVTVTREVRPAETERYDSTCADGRLVEVGESDVFGVTPGVGFPKAEFSRGESRKSPFFVLRKYSKWGCESGPLVPRHKESNHSS